MVAIVGGGLSQPWLSWGWLCSFAVFGYSGSFYHRGVGFYRWGEPRNLASLARLPGLDYWGKTTNIWSFSVDV
jgi:hypothetical protein